MELINIITNYVKENNTDFAILINGKWGSGKTYFVNHEISSEISKIECSGNNKSKKYFEVVYLSLYGLTSADELQKKLFLEINPVFKTKPGKLSAAVLSKTLGYIGLNIDENDQNELLNIFGGIPRHKVLVFDDLERLETKTLNEVFGFINSYTEHQKLKVIIIADEQRIRTKIQDYELVKEKLVRFTYLFNPDLADVLPDFILKYESNDYQEYLKQKKKFICDAFRRGEHRNLRTLRFVLDVFNAVFLAVLKNSRISQSNIGLIAERYLFFIITYCIAYKDGASREDLDSLENLSRELDNHENSMWLQAFIKEMHGDKEEVTIKDNSFKQRFENSFLDHTKNDFQFFSVIAHYIHSGDLDVGAIDRTSVLLDLKFNERMLKPEQIVLAKLKETWEIDDEDFLPLTSKLLDYVKDGIYKLEVYPMVFKILCRFSSDSIEGFKVDDGTVSIFKEGMDKAVKISDYKKRFTDDTDMYAEKSELLDEIRDYASRLNDKLLLKFYGTMTDRFWQTFSAGQFEDLEALIAEEGVQSNPIFQVELLNPETLFSSFLGFSNKQKVSVLYSFQQLMQRFSDHGLHLKKEQEFFETLQSLIHRRIEIDSSRKHVSTYLLNRLDYFVQHYLEHLK